MANQAGGKVLSVSGGQGWIQSWGLVGHKQPAGLHLQACGRPLGCPVWDGDGAEVDE